MSATRRSIGSTVVVAGMLAMGAVRPVAAQAARTCFVVVDSTGGVGRQVDVGGGFVRWFQGGGIWAHCRRQATAWYSDSIAWYQEADRFDMLGGVDFRDASVHLTADRARYYTRDERLEAYGNAVLTNLRTGSVLRGPNLTYRRVAPGVRDTSDWVATGRPVIEYRSAEDAAGAEPYLIEADRVSLVGEAAASAEGRVTIDRSDFRARADSATLNTEIGEGRLVGHAEVTGGDSAGFTLRGRVIDYRLTDGELTWVQAEERAEALNEEWHITADSIQFDLVNQRMEHGAAWGDSSRPRAASPTHTITADSLAIDAPGQQLSEVRGIGTSQAASRADSMDTETDWLAGDTVIARFDTTAGGTTQLMRLEARGNARARYRVYPESRPMGPPDLSYSRGDRIVAVFVAERVSRVDVAGQSDGVYLEARRQRP